MSDEPIAYINLDEQRLEFAVPFQFNRSCFKQGKLPLYLHPAEPERKSMTEDEITKEFSKDSRHRTLFDSFKNGIRYAEKHHGIVENDE